MALAAEKKVLDVLLTCLPSTNRAEGAPFRCGARNMLRGLRRNRPMSDLLCPVADETGKLLKKGSAPLLRTPTTA